MRNTALFFLITMVISLSMSNVSYAAFPLKTAKNETVTVATTSNTAIATAQQAEHYSFIHKILHPTDSIFGLFSLLSLVFGALGLIVAFFTAAGFALGLAAVVLGAIGLYMGSERMMATLGIILGIVAIVIALIV